MWQACRVRRDRSIDQSIGRSNQRAALRSRLPSWRARQVPASFPPWFISRTTRSSDCPVAAAPRASYLRPNAENGETVGSSDLPRPRARPRSGRCDAIARGEHGRARATREVLTRAVASRGGWMGAPAMTTTTTTTTTRRRDDATTRRRDDAATRRRDDGACVACVACVCATYSSCHSLSAALRAGSHLRAAAARLRARGSPGQRFQGLTAPEKCSRKRRTSASTQGRRERQSTPTTRAVREKPVR